MPHVPSLEPDFAAGLAGARVLVTGGSGFIGTNLVAAYRRAGVAVTNADIAPPQNPHDQDAWLRTDLTRLDEVERAFSVAHPTHVFHLGARTDLNGKSLEDYQANIAGVANVLNVLRNSPSVTRIVVASSRMVCRIAYEPKADDDYCPTTTYGRSKVETERLVRAATTLPWVLVRPTSIWGPWFGAPYRDFFLRIARGHYVHPAGRRIPKTFGFVGNSVWQLHSVMRAGSAEVLGHTFYLADDPPIEVGDFARRISSAMGRRPARSAPTPVLRAVARAGDTAQWLGIRAPLTSFRLDNLLTPMVHDVAELMRLSGPLPYDEAFGINATVDWMRREGLLHSGR